MTSLWLEASRDVEAEYHEHDLGVAKMATANLWPFLALARTEGEFEHRLALAMDQIESRVQHQALRDEVISSFREDFGIYTEARAAEEAAAEPVEFFHEASGKWITVDAAAQETPGNPWYPNPEPEEGPETGQTGTFPQHPTGGDPVNPMQGEYPMQPEAWREEPDLWVDRPMNFAPYTNPGTQKSSAATPHPNHASHYTDEGVETGTGPNPFYFAGGDEGVAGDQQTGYPADVSLPEPDERVDYYGTTPPVQSGGTQGDGHTYSNENGLNTHAYKNNHAGDVATAEADRKRSNVGACYDCNRPVYRHGNEWKHLDGDKDHYPRLPGNHPWVQDRMQQLHFSGARQPLQKGERVRVLNDFTDEDNVDRNDNAVHVPAGTVLTVHHRVDEPDDDGNRWIGLRHRKSDTGHVYTSEDNLRRVPKPKTAKNKYIHQRGDKWVITQKGTGKVLSEHDSEEKAEESFSAMMMSKHSAFNDREAALHEADMSSSDTGPNPGDSTSGSSTPTPPPSMQQGGPGAEAMPPMQPMTIPNQSVSQSPFPNEPAGGGGGAPANPFMGAKTAEQTRDRPDMFNPTGVGDEYTERTWEGQISGTPRQPIDERNVNTPQRPQQPIRQTTSDGGGARPQEEEEEQD